MGFSALNAVNNTNPEKLLVELHNQRCLFTLEHSNDTNHAGYDTRLPSLSSMSGSPVLQFAYNIADQHEQIPRPVGVFIRDHKLEHTGGYSMLQPAVTSATAALNANCGDYLLRDLRRQRNAITELLLEYNVTNLRVFGSTARNEDNKDSDIDLVARFEHGYNMLRNRIPLSNKLALLMGRNVDLIPEHELNPTIYESVLQETLPL